MKKENIIQEKTFAFAIRIVNFYKYLRYSKQEFVISKQILRSGTSIGANIEESIGAVSEKEFFQKISIAYKESRESIYWIKLLFRTNYISSKQYQSLITDANEICKIIGTIQISIKNKLNTLSNQKTSL